MPYIGVTTSIIAEFWALRDGLRLASGNHTLGRYGLMVDYGLLEVVVVSSVCSAAAVGGGGHVVMVFSVKFVVVEQKE